MLPAPTSFLEQHWNRLLEAALAIYASYLLHKYLKGTRGARIFVGLMFCGVTWVLLSHFFAPVDTGWITGNQAIFLFTTLVIVLQPELRRLLAALGGLHWFVARRQDRRTIDLVCDGVLELANLRYGALIALERGTGLKNYVETGVFLDAVFSRDLLITVFHPKTSLHDGGMILRDDRIVAAACIFPVSLRDNLDRSYGLRHRAGLGLCEETDAVAVVVSEETGSVSLCYRRGIERGLTLAELRTRLNHVLFEKSSRFARLARTSGTSVDAPEQDTDPEHL